MRTRSVSDVNEMKTMLNDLFDKKRNEAILLITSINEDGGYLVNSRDLSIEKLNIYRMKTDKYNLDTLSNSFKSRLSRQDYLKWVCAHGALRLYMPFDFDLETDKPEKHPHWSKKIIEGLKNPTAHIRNTIKDKISLMPQVFIAKTNMKSNPIDALGEHERMIYKILRESGEGTHVDFESLASTRIYDDPDRPTIGIESIGRLIIHLKELGLIEANDHEAWTILSTTKKN